VRLLLDEMRSPTIARELRALHYEALAPGGPGDHGMMFIPGDYRAPKPIPVESSPRCGGSRLTLAGTTS
jgi:hypothetical protein